MASNQKKKGTPGRPRKKGNQYFEVGKVGRKTGITLEDKGIRDQHGLEPVSHIFSSPATTPQRDGDRTLTSSDMLVQQSSAPDVDTTLRSRKTPRLPPARASTPKHTNIGSPKRMSTGRPVSQRLDVDVLADGSPARPRTQPPPNRKLDFGGEAPDTVHKSIESGSPFKPKHVLRRSIGSARPNPFASPAGDAKSAGDTKPTRATTPIEQSTHDESDEEPSPVRDAEPVVIEDDAEPTEAGAEEEPEPDAKEAEVSMHDGPVQFGDDDFEDEIVPQEATLLPEDVEPRERQQTPVTRQSETPRTIHQSLDDITQILQNSPSRGRKRSRDHLEEQEASISHVVSEAAAPSQKKRRGRPPKDRSSLIVHQDDGDAAIDPELLAHGDHYVDEDEDAEAADQVPELPAKAKGKGRKGRPAKERDANRNVKSSSVQLNDSPSKMRGSAAPASRGGSMGPVSNVHLRATTPFEDANERTSRYGRNLYQPLKYWANEAKVYKHGELESIVRADDVEKPKRKTKRRKGKKVRKGISRLDDADEDSETESVVPDEWEDEVGVIAGNVANWDPATQMGDSEDLIREDLAFASSAIVTRDVANSEFKYAKIMTLPFFGSGVVELPPEGFKRAKNSRKMQMCFFVHEGKVMVDLGAANSSETNQFAVSKGGAWVVPRGNNYAITNESTTKTARIFFAQGCEMPAGEGVE